MMPTPAVRKTAFLVEDSFSDRGNPAAEPLRRVAAIAVLKNPCIGMPADDLSPLTTAATALGERLMPTLSAMLGAPVVGYGKAAIVGTMGQVEHAAAILHPTLGKPMRDAIGGGTALIPSNGKLGALGATIDVPIGHRNSPWAFGAIDTMTVGLADAPRPDEIVLVIALTSSDRPDARIVGPKTD
jgi:hypothetical protein